MTDSRHGIGREKKRKIGRERERGSELLWQEENVQTDRLTEET